MHSSVIQTLTVFAFLAISVKAQEPAYVDRISPAELLERNWALNYELFSIALKASFSWNPVLITVSH